jgi:hypothetical protein
MSQFKIASLENLKSDMLLSSPHIHRDYVHPSGVTRIFRLMGKLLLYQKKTMGKMGKFLLIGQNFFGPTKY